MKYLNLDTGFNPYGTGIVHEQFVFPGGEPHIRIHDEIEPMEAIMITHRVRSFSDMGLLLVAVDALRRTGVKEIELTLPYFPGARQDRFMVAGEPLTVKVYADLINTQDLDKVIVLDPHSDVTPALLNRVEVVSNITFAKTALANFEEYTLVSPDAGALKKATTLAMELGKEEVVICNKKRNLATGELSNIEVFAKDLGGKTCVVVDDICDGGGTFLGLAKALKAKNAGRLVLIVTHGIFSKGSTDLVRHYDRIICTDSFQTLNYENIQQIELNHNLLNQQP